MKLHRHTGPSCYPLYNPTPPFQTASLLLETPGGDFEAAVLLLSLRSASCRGEAGAPRPCGAVTELSLESGPWCDPRASAFPFRPGLGRRKVAGESPPTRVLEAHARVFTHVSRAHRCVQSSGRFRQSSRLPRAGADSSAGRLFTKSLQPSAPLQNAITCLWSP